MARKRLLIVDDEALSRTIMRDVLELAGYGIAEAADGPDGLAKAESLRPDLILLDVLMPGLDGYEVCRRLKADPRTSPLHKKCRVQGGPSAGQQGVGTSNL